MLLVDITQNQFIILSNLLNKLEQWMKNEKRLPFMINRMKNRLVIFKTLRNRQIRTMMKLKNLLSLERLLKKPEVNLMILIQNQVFILKYQLQDLYMMITHIRHLHILGLWILMPKRLIKMIRIQQGESIRQLMNPIF